MATIAVVALALVPFCEISGAAPPTSDALKACPLGKYRHHGFWQCWLCAAGRYGGGSMASSDAGFSSKQNGAGAGSSLFCSGACPGGKYSKQGDAQCRILALVNDHGS